MGIAPLRRDPTPAPEQEGIHAKAKVCLVGADTGCKTKLVRNHVREGYDDRYLVTLGTKVSKKELTFVNIHSNATVRLDLLVWDIAGDRRFRHPLHRAFFGGAEGIIAVSDMTRRSTVMELDDWIRDVRGVTGPIPVVVVAANDDQKNRLQVSEEEMRRVAKKVDAPCFFASKSSSEGVEAAFGSLAAAIVRSRLGPSRTRG